MPDVHACPQCGEAAMPGAAFCAYCGAKLPDTRPVAPRNVLPVPDRQGLAGPCSLIHVGEGEVDVRLIGKLVAETAERPLSDVTRDLRTSKGIIATGLDAPKALSLAAKIESQPGHDLLVIPDGAIVPIPPPMRTNRLTISAVGIQGQAYTWDLTEEFSCSWEKVFLIACGRLESQYVPESASPNSSGFFLGRPQRDEPAITQHEFLVDIVLEDPWRRLRLDQNVAGFSFTEINRDPAEAKGSLYRMAINLDRYAKGVPVNSGLHLMAAGGADTGWEQLTFLAKRDFDLYIHWLIQLVRFGRNIPF